MPIWLAKLILFFGNRVQFIILLVLVIVACCYFRIYELWWTPPEVGP